MNETEEKVEMCDPDTWSGKTSPELFQVTEGKTSGQSSKKQRASSIKPPLFLDLRTENGQTPELSWQTGGALLGEFSTRSFGEYPSAVVESHLSQILEDNPHLKYFLSAKACQGILRRAETRGKELPPILKEALILQIKRGGGITYCIQGNCIDRADTAGCNGKGWTEDVSYTLNTIDRPAICYSIDRAAFNQGENAKFDFEISDKGTAPTLVSRGPSAVCYPKESTEPRFAAAFKSNMSAKTYGIGYEEDIAPTISAEQHDASVVYAIGNGQADNTGLHEKVGAFNCMHDQQAVLDFGRIADRIYINADKSVTLQAQGGGGGAKTGLYFFADKAIVRRLTPLECERLQGFPDGWTDIGDYIDGKGKCKKTTDSARYKVLGNSIAIPPWTWVLSRLNDYCEEHTMASLFDGIGGFPLIWERLNGKGSCLWASEIEDFPIAVTKRRFINSSTDDMSSEEITEYLINFFRNGVKE